MRAFRILVEIVIFGLFTAATWILKVWDLAAELRQIAKDRLGQLRHRPSRPYENPKQSHAKVLPSSVNHPNK